MNNPCIDCTNKVVDEYGLFCDLACGKHTAYINYQAGIKEVVEWINNNYTYFPRFNEISLPNKEYQSKLKSWNISE